MSSNGATRPKRKPSHSPEAIRPQKRERFSPEEDSPKGPQILNGSGSPFDVAVGIDEEEEDDEEMEYGESDKIFPLVAGTHDSAEWQKTIERVVKSVVSIRFCLTCSFDTESAETSEATGFIVDSEKGYILTNRHVVSPGPFWGYVVLDNHEEVDVWPVYRDPIHDFGILRFDPKAIKYMPVVALKLRPDLARVGTEIRVVGNDAGEKLSILSGIISRTDRNAPDYGDGYNDFNTNYIQAAASASGGSSGSPVIDINGYAVALQAGGASEAATDYFLPLDRPLRALQCIQNGQKITRGTLQTQWLIKPFDECRRLGLTQNWEDAVRKGFPEEIGMLVVETVLPEGPAHNQLEEGDILIRVNGELLTKFIRLDDILDSSVGKRVVLHVQRGGEDLELDLEVGDLHAITPDRFLSVCGASFHDLSYQVARYYAIPVRGVYVCEPSGSFRFDGSEKGWLIESIDHKKTPDLKTFTEVMKGIPDKARVVVSYRQLRDMHTMHTSIIFIDRHWTGKMRMAVRNDETGLWDFTELEDALPPEPAKPRSAQFIKLDNVGFSAASDLVRSFVRVSCNVAIKIDGFPKPRKTGFGLVVDAEKGLVVVSRAIVPYDFGDITITVAESIIVEAKVLFLHPLQNFVVIQYDPKLVDAPVQSARLSETYIKQGESTIFLGFNQNQRVVVGRTTVTDITTVAVPANSPAPRYRAINVDAITVDSNLSGQCGSGVLAADDGTVRALWLTYLGERSHGDKDMDYHLGLATPTVLPVIRQIQAGIEPKLQMLPVELHLVHMSQARIMGVSDEWIRKVEEDNEERHHLFMVRKIECGTTQSLEEGDLILAINGKIMTRISDLDIMYDNKALKMTIVRNSKQMELDVPTNPTEDLETNRVVVFCGAVLHRPHHAVRQQISVLHSQIYVSGRVRGSPAYQYGLVPTNFILAVNGVKTPDLDSFLAEVEKIPDNTYLRLRVMTFDNIPFVITLKKNEHYFPTMEFIKDPQEECGWSIKTYEKGKIVKGMDATNSLEGVEDV